LARSPLEAELRERIAREGSLSFRDVMQAALYHPAYGYYTNLRGFGASGDFTTGPEQHPAFGWLLGRQAIDVWEALDRPHPFRILELGAGSGALAHSLASFMRETPADIVYSIDEPSPSLRAIQHGRLEGPEFNWNSAQEPAHFIIANEVADALPVHRAVMRGGALHELRVGVDTTDNLVWVEADGAPPELSAYFEALQYTPPDGDIVDVSLYLADWIKSISRTLARGVALVIDYAASPPRDTLLTYYRHTLGSDPLVRLGQQDISAHVDLRTLVRIARAEGMGAVVTSQRGLLLNLGFAQVRARLRGSTDRQALARLVDPNGPGSQIAGAFLIRDLPGYTPAGAVGRDWPEPRHIPSLPPDQDETDFLDQWREAFSAAEEEN
jgi:SAM-dependent MidA family methyltransferase